MAAIQQVLYKPKAKQLKQDLTDKILSESWMVCQHKTPLITLKCYTPVEKGKTQRPLGNTLVTP